MANFIRMETVPRNVCYQMLEAAVIFCLALNS